MSSPKNTKDKNVPLPLDSGRVLMSAMGPLKSPGYEKTLWLCEKTLFLTCREDSFAKQTSKGLGDSRVTPAIEVSWNSITSFAIEINNIERSLTHTLYKTHREGKEAISEMAVFSLPLCLAEHLTALFIAALSGTFRCS